MDFGMASSGQDDRRNYNSREIGFHDILNQARQSVGGQHTEETENLNAHLGFLMQQVKERNERSLQEMGYNEQNTSLSASFEARPEAKMAAPTQGFSVSEEYQQSQRPIAPMLQPVHNPSAKSPTREVISERERSEAPSQGQADDFEGFQAYREFCQYKEYLKFQDKPAFQSDFRRFFDWWRENQKEKSADATGIFPITGGEGRHFEHEFVELGSPQEEGEIEDQPQTGKKPKHPHSRFLASHSKFSFYPNDPLVYFGQGIKHLQEFVMSCEREYRLCPAYFPTEQSKVLWAARRLAKKPASAWYNSLQLEDNGTILMDEFQDHLWEVEEAYTWNRFKRVLYEDLQEENEVGKEHPGFNPPRIPSDLPSANSVPIKKSAAVKRAKELKEKLWQQQKEQRETKDLRFNGDSSNEVFQYQSYDPAEGSTRDLLDRPSAPASLRLEEAVSRPMGGDELVQLFMDSAEDQSNTLSLPASTSDSKQMEDARRELDRRLGASLRQPSPPISNSLDEIMDEEQYVMDITDTRSPYHTSRSFSIDYPVSGRVEPSRRFPTRARGFRARGRAAGRGRGGRGGRGQYRGHQM